MAACLLLICYFNGLFGPFFLDDFANIPPAYLSHFEWGPFLNIVFNNHSGPLGRPISIASFALNFLFTGESVFYFKLVNLLLHFLTGSAIYVLLKSLLKRTNISPNLIFPIAFFSTLIWLLHPLNVSTVLYTVQRMTMLSSLFTVLALIFYLKGRQEKTVYRWILVCFLIFFPLSILSKENGILLPVYIFLIEYFFIKEKAPIQLKGIGFIFGVMPIVATLIYFWLNASMYQATYVVQGLTPLTRFLTEIKILFLYASWIFWPRLTELGLFHDDIPILTLQSSLGIFCLTGLLITVFSIYFLRKRMPMLAFGLSWFLVSHLLESTVIPLELVFEHRNYLASIGLILIFVYYLFQVLHTKQYAWISTLLVFLLSIHFGILTFLRTHVWSDPALFYAMSVKNHPNSTRAHLEWANVLLKNNDYENALHSLEEAKTLSPHQNNADLQILLVHCRLNQLPEAIFNNALTAVKNLPLTPYSLTALDLLVDNKLNDACPTISEQKINALLAQSLENKNIYKNPNWLSLLYQLRARSLLLVKAYPEAITFLEKAYDIYPKRIEPLLEKLTIQINIGDYAAGEQTLAELEAIMASRPYLEYQLEPFYTALQKLKDKQIPVDNQPTRDPLPII